MGHPTYLVTDLQTDTIERRNILISIMDTPCLLQLDGQSLTIEDVVAIARQQRAVDCALSPEAVKRIEASHRLKQELIATKQPIYGVTTGFGDSCRRQISPEKARDLQRHLVLYHINGTGPIAAPEVVRATMLIRANCLARGHSAPRVVVVNRLLDYLKWDILPLIPERGSVGASGDLVPLCYLAAALIGEGDVSQEGRIKDVQEVLAELELEPLTLEAKEGLALINGTSFMSAFAAFATRDAMELAFVADVCTAMAAEALCGNRGHFSPFIHQQKPHPGQVRSAQNIFALLESSELARTHQQILATNESLSDLSYLELDHSIQDKYSLRCAPHVIGVLYDTIEWVRRWVEIEINSANDNPLFDVQTHNVYSGGNFYGGHIVQAMDSLKVAVANIADLLDRQLELIVDEKFNNGLTPNLIAPLGKDDYEVGLFHGFKGMQIACSALTAEALKLSNPVSVFSRSTEAHNQDKVSMGTIAARDARSIIELVQEVVAIHLLALCQAMDLRGPENMSPKTQAAYRLIRAVVPFVDRDRRMDTDIKHVVHLIRTSAFQRAILPQSEAPEYP